MKEEDGCGEAPPTVEALRITNNGLYLFGEAELPSIELEIDAVDVDGALHAYVFEAWYDNIVDGKVMEEDAPLRVSDTLSEDTCKTERATLRMILAVNGDPPADTLLEFGVRLKDGDGQQSEMVTADFVTPKEDGSEPDP